MTDTDSAILAKLDELVQITREASLGDRYLDTKGVAALLGFSYTYTRDKIVHKPGFPKASHLGGRWLRSDVLRWAKSGGS